MSVVFWFRRDLRLNDNAGLYHALKAGRQVMPVFIFDRNILDELSRKDARVHFIHRAVTALKAELKEYGACLQVFYDTPEQAFRKLITSQTITAVYANHDYEPYAHQRDQAVYNMLGEKGIKFYTYKDQVIFEKDEVRKEDKTPYTVFTPYSKKWKHKLNAFYLKAYPVHKYTSNFLKQHPYDIPSLKQMGFEETNAAFPSPQVAPKTIREYDIQRDIPYANSTTHLGIHLRFGTISIRQLAKRALELNETFLNELIWRDFFQMILFHFPYVISKAFKPQYDNIRWRYNEKDFQRWCEGNTGYPIVDAGMRELNATGIMHNRVRMIAASFLIKHLLIDWRLGEAYFAEKLLDYDLAANNGNWQWVAGCGCDAAPYFRVFNPVRQTEKFDPEFRYIKKWVPEFGTPKYPAPMVRQEEAKDRCLQAYKTALKKN